VTVGFPDWSRTVNQGGFQEGSFFGQKGTDPTTGVMDCLGFAYLTIEVGDKNNVHNFSIVVTWYSDFQGINIVGTTVFSPVPGSVIPVQVPLVARWARVTCSHQVFGDTENVGCIVFGSNVQTVDIAGAQQTAPFIVGSATVNASSSQFFPALYTRPGPCVVTIYTDVGTNCVVQLEYFDIGSASWKALRKWHLTAGVNDTDSRLSLPSCPARIGLYNNDTVAHTLTGIVTSA